MLNALLYLTILLFSFGQLGRISIHNQQVNFYLYELSMAIVLAVSFFKYRFKPLSLSWNKIRLVYFFLGYLLLSFLINIPQYGWQRNLVGFLYWGRLLFYWLFFVYIYRHITKKHLFVFIWLTVTSSLVQFFLYPNLRNLIYLGWDPHYHRLFGVFFDTSVAAAVYGLIFLYLLIINTNLITIVIYLAFIVLTYSRSAYIVLFATMFYYFFSRRQLKLFIAGVFIFLTMLIFIPTNFGRGVGLTRVFSIESRLTDYHEAISVWTKNPLIGIGYNHIRRGQGHASASYSSSFLIILVTGGIVGLALFGALLYRLVISNKHAVLYVIFLGLMSFTDNILLHPFIMFLLGSVLLVGDR